MTPRPVRPATEDAVDETVDATLGGLIDVLGSAVLRVLTAPAGLDVVVTGAAIHDPLAPRVEPGDLLLAVGIDPGKHHAIEVIESLAPGNPAAIVVKASADVPSGLVDAAGRAGFALLAVPEEIYWGQLHTLIRTTLASLGRSPDVANEATPVGNLFSLANAVAAMVGGAVTIEDVHSTVLAYSSMNESIDDARRQTILGRRVPDAWLRRLQDKGVFRRLWATDEVIRVEFDPEFETQPRLAVAVRAGGENLGSIWVAEDRVPLGPEAEVALREAARLAALHLIRHHASQDLERQRRSDLLRAVLEDRVAADVAAGPLGLRAAERCAVIAFEGHGSEGDASMQAERALDFIALYCEAFRRRSVAAAIGRRVYVLLPSTEPDGLGNVLELAGNIISRAGAALRFELRAGVGSAAPGLAEAWRSRRDADQVLRVLAVDTKGRTAATIDDVRSQALLLELQDLAASQEHFRLGPLQELVEHDAKRGTLYIETLRAYLDAFGDIPAAAANINVHPNTFRYRLRRLVALAQLNLDDPDERVVLELQLRF